VQKKMRLVCRIKCKLGERIKNPIRLVCKKKMRLVCRRKCRLGERIKSHQVGVQKKMQACKRKYDWLNQIPSGWCAEENAGMQKKMQLVCV